MIYSNEFLSKESLQLFKYAKTLRTTGYISVYTAREKIYVRKSVNKGPILIRCEQDVDNILLEATITSGRVTGSRHQPATIDDEVSDRPHVGTHFK